MKAQADGHQLVLPVCLIAVAKQLKETCGTTGVQYSTIPQMTLPHVFKSKLHNNPNRLPIYSCVPLNYSSVYRCLIQRSIACLDSLWVCLN